MVNLSKLTYSFKSVDVIEAKRNGRQFNELDVHYAFEWWVPICAIEITSFFPSKNNNSSLSVKQLFIVFCVTFSLASYKYLSVL